MSRLNDFIGDSSIIIIERIKNPFFISLISAWLYLHRVDFTDLLNSKLSETEIIKLIKSQFLTFSWCAFLELIGFTFLFLLSYTFFSLIAYMMNAFAVKVVKPSLTRWFDPKGFVSAQENRENLDSLAKAETALRRVEQASRSLAEERDEAIQDKSEMAQTLRENVAEKSRLEQELQEVRKQAGLPPNLERIFPGKWMNEYETPEGETGREYFEIRNKNQYWASSRKDMNSAKHAFDVRGYVENNDQIIFAKAKVDGSAVAVNRLKKESEFLLVGEEGIGSQLETHVMYRKLD